MKKFLIISLLLAACSAGSNKNKEVQKPEVTEQAAVPENKFAGINFASTKDLSCGMPLSAGIEDTAHYNGKIYGFCSKECKDDFLKDPQKHIVKK